MTDSIVVELYISSARLKNLYEMLTGHSDESEWPFEFFECIMDAHEIYDDLFEKASQKIGRTETQRQLDLFAASRGNA